MMHTAAGVVNMRSNPATAAKVFLDRESGLVALVEKSVLREINK
jgi:hypothetical protein